MTMPSLIQNSKKQETSARLKKFYSMMSQALVMSQEDNGMIEDWGKPSNIYDDDGKYDEDANSEISDAFFTKYIAPYFKYVSAEKDANFHKYTKVILTDGSIFYVRNGGCYDILYDTNGDRKPNTEGRDQFYFVICTKKGLEANSLTNTYFGAYCPVAYCNTREKAIQQCKNHNDQCAGILQLDNWEVKDDYPIRL